MTALRLPALLLALVLAIAVRAQPQYVSNSRADFVKLMFVGDVNMNAELLQKATYDDGQRYGFQNFFQLVRPVLNLGHIVVGNLETTFGEPPYGRYPSFRSPEALATSLKYAGFTHLAMANQRFVNTNEMDWSLHTTICERNGLGMLGAYGDSVQRNAHQPHIIERKNVKVALLNYAQSVQHRLDVFPVVNGTDRDVIERDIQAAKEAGADYVVVYMNWGREYENIPNFTQQALARHCFDAGANLVVGTHPKVVQTAETERYYQTDGYRDGLVIYSMGNFSTNVTARYSDAGIILEVILRKDKATGVTEMVDQAFLPIWGYHYTDVDSNDRYALLPISQVEQGHVSVTMDPDHRFNMTESGNDIRRKLGGTVNEVEYTLNDTIISQFNEVLYVTRQPLNDKSTRFEREGRPELEAVNTARRGEYQAIDRPETPDPEPTPDPVEDVAEDQIIYRVQFMALNRLMEVDTRYYRHLEGYIVRQEEGVYRYMIGQTTNKKEANSLCLDVRRYGHKDAFVVVYKNGQRINLGN